MQAIRNEEYNLKEANAKSLTTGDVSQDGTTKHCGEIREKIELKNHLDESLAIDTLHHEALASHCNRHCCYGSVMFPENGENEAPGELRKKYKVQEEARDFLRQYYASKKSENSDAHIQRLTQVCKEVEETGTYSMEEKELIFGALLAWRNAARCVGRIQWKKLQVFDCRHVKTPSEMFECILQHLKYATNKGKLRSTLTIFPQLKGKLKDFRIWNSQLVRYAGYKQPNGAVIGDPASIKITEIALQYGWKAPGTHFDVLPLILQAHGEEPQLFEIPPEYVLEVHLHHPNYPKFAELGLKWYALPAVANLSLDCGGLQFTAAPFNGWYMASEISARNLVDSSRYNLIRPIAKVFGFDTSNNTTLWRDKTVVELTYATLHSFNQAGVTIVDHHTITGTFIKHFNDESKLRGGCPADWVWIVPPLAGASTPVFHQEVLNYHLKPSYEYQVEPWKYFSFVYDKSPGKKVGFETVAKMVKCSTKLFSGVLAKRHKVTILYATETGKSETYAKRLNEVFLFAFHSKVICMDDYNFPDIEDEQCILVVASTFGNGEAPDNGEAFGQFLYEMVQAPRENEETAHAIHTTLRLSTLPKSDKLANLRYAVFALGSKAYPHFCAFGHSINQLIGKLGGEQIHQIGEGDELCGQEESFKLWSFDCFKAACEMYCVPDVNLSEASIEISLQERDWENKFQIELAEKDEEDLCAALSVLHRKHILPNKAISVENLQAAESSRITDLVKLDTCKHPEMMYEPGDHLCVYPCNNASIVEELLSRVSTNVSDIDALTYITCRPDEALHEWKSIEKFPTPSSLRRVFSSFLDINSPPSTKLLSVFAEHCSNKEEQMRLKDLSTNNELYGDWKYTNFPNILEVLQEFKHVDADVNMLICLLPVLQPRYYSISSSSALYPNEIHATVAMVSYVVTENVTHFGTCSSWLHSLKKDDIVPCSIKKAQAFHLPHDASVPVILIGPGTGIAPFRSFWQQRIFENRHSSAKKPQEMVLFFGCRNSTMDNIYVKETDHAKEVGALSKLYTAYSREPGQPKCYVQHLLKDNLEEVCDMLVSGDGQVYVCGDVTMAADVCKTLTDMIQIYLALSNDAANEYVNMMKRSGKYHEDIFGVTLKTKEITNRTRTAVKRSKSQGQRSETT